MSSPAFRALDRAGLVAGVLCLVAMGCGGRPGPPPPAPADARPSMLLISIDTLRADHVGAYGAAGAETPNLDALAREGVLFERALSPVPITLPAHASMLTGLLPSRHGVRDNGLYRLPAEAPTLAATLAAAGYDTGAVVAAAVLDRQYGLARGFRLYDDVSPRAGLAIAERPASEVTDAALAVARQLRPPFLLFVHYFDPHAAYRAPREIAERFGDRGYDAEVAYVDRELGRLRRELAERLRGGATLVTADHGESLGEHGEATHGVFIYQATLHVPLIVVAPGWPAGRRVGGLASNLDVAPTLLEIASQPPPAGLDGRALGSVARGGAGAARWLALESEFGLDSYGWAPLRGLTDGRLKWIDAPEAELYDLGADPREERNLASGRGADVSRLSQEWRRTVVQDRRSAPGPVASDAESAERLARLSALGYVAGSRADAAPKGGLPDPKRAIGSLALVNEARQLIGAGRPDDALRRLAAAQRVSPRNVSALVLSGVAQLGAGRPGQALLPLRRAAAIAPANAEVQFNLGLACIGTNDPDCAEAAFRRTLALAPRSADAAVNLADLLIQTGRPEPARRVVAAARREGLAGGLLDFLDGKLAWLSGDRAAAAAPLRRALDTGTLPGPAADEARRMLAAVP